MLEIKTEHHNSAGSGIIFKETGNGFYGGGIFHRLP